MADYKPMSPLVNGQFVDFEVINQLINNIVDTRKEIPYMAHRSVKGSRTNNIDRKFHILGGFVNVSGLKNSPKTYKVAFSSAFLTGTPVLVTGTNMANVRVWTTGLSGKSFNMNVVGLDTRVRSGWISWMAWGPANV